jgi:hypothetical protein
MLARFRNHANRWTGEEEEVCKDESEPYVGER